MEKKRKYSVGQMTMDGAITAILVILGMIKIPSFIPGAEFQLSAPFAVLVVSGVGFMRYLGIGVCASAIQLMLGTHTLWNVLIAMVFRMVAGAIVTFFSKKTGLYLAGPLGTLCGRIVLAVLLNVPAIPLITAAVPGMIFTVVCVYVFAPVMKRLLSMGNI